MSAKEDDNLCLKWSDYNSNMTRIFDQLLQQESLVDVTITTSCGKSIKCHKLVLSASSGYFQKLFMSNPSSHFVIVLADVPWRVLIHVIEYLYRGQINVSVEDIGPLLRAARILQIKGIMDLIKPLQDAAVSKKRRRESEKKGEVHNTNPEIIGSPTNSPKQNSAFQINNESPSDEEDFEVKEEMLEVTPGIMEMDDNSADTSKWKITNSHSLNEATRSAPSQDNLGNYQDQLKSLLQRYVDHSFDGGSPSQLPGTRGERGPTKSWSADTMAQAMWSVLQKGFSLNRAARSFDIPYPTFALYANRVHNMLGPSNFQDSPDSALRPKGRGRPQRILKGQWHESHIRQVIQAVVYRRGGGGTAGGSVSGIKDLLPSVSVEVGGEEFTSSTNNNGAFEDAEENERSNLQYSSAAASSSLQPSPGFLEDIGS